VTRLPKAGRLATPLFFALAAAFTGGGAAHAVSRTTERPTLHLALVAAYALLRTAIALAFALFTIGRAAPARHSRSPLAIASCVTAMAAVVAFAPPGPSVPTAEIAAGELLAVVSAVWLLLSVSYLGRCFGVLPEARGLVTSGPYRRVRHPVYLGELGACLGLVIAAPSFANALLLALFGAAQGTRMVYEERALTEAFPEYAAYAARTPRLIPSRRAAMVHRQVPSLIGEQPIYDGHGN
jgi:protein-S-isoprenylcysteine O-methyltransferase Ste14